MDGCDDICDGRVFSLIHSDEKTGVEVIMQFSFDDLGAADAARGYSEGARQKLFEKVAGGLEERENKEMVEWMRRQFVRLPEDVAPWERDRPIRNLDIPLEEAEMSLNDSGNATRFEAEVDGWLSCEVKPTPKDPELKWFAYNYFYWKRAVNEAVVAGRRVAASIAGGEVKRWGAVYGIERDTRTNDPDAKENPLEKRLSKFVNALTKHSQISNNQSRIEAMISLAGQTNLTVNVTKISNPHLLALKNGLFDTSVGMFYPLYQCEQFKNQYPTRYIDATYTPGKTSEIFYSALLSMFTDNTTPELSTDEKIKRSFRMAEYVLRILGYGLLAGNPKQKIIILCGGSSNGKSLLMDTLAGILGDEFGRAPIRELAVVKEDKAAGGTTAGVRKRILYYAEGGGDDITLSSAAVKTMTDTYVTFRAQHKDPEPQFNCCLPFISCNTFPRFDEVDAAIMRRVLVVPCLHRFVEGV
ncbi:MAG: hypothetical protein Q4Q04_05245, partial [Methanocorpusculum sp.]|nr:hypothetical protein [Methanocorpusculum sp.]